MDVLDSFVSYASILMEQERSFIPSNHPALAARRMEVLRHLTQERFSSKPPRRQRIEDPEVALAEAHDRARVNREEVDTPRAIRIAKQILDLPPVPARPILGKRAASEPPTTSPPADQQEHPKRHHASKRVRWNEEDDTMHAAEVETANEPPLSPSVSAGVAGDISIAAMTVLLEPSAEAGPSRLPIQTMKQGSQRRQANARRKFERTASEPLAIFGSFKNSPSLVPSPVAAVPAITLTQATPPAHTVDDMVLSTPDAATVAASRALLRTPTSSPRRATVSRDAPTEATVADDDASEDEDETGEDASEPGAETAAPSTEPGLETDVNGIPIRRGRRPRRCKNMPRPERTSIPVMWVSQGNPRFPPIDAVELAASDRFGPELHYFADVGADFSLAAQRVIDSVPAAILLHYGQEFVSRMKPALHAALGIDEEREHAQGQGKTSQQTRDARRTELEAKKQQAQAFLTRLQAAMGGPASPAEGAGVPFPSVEQNA